MTSARSIDDKEIIFLNASVLRDYRGMPDEVRNAADVRIAVLQNNGRLPARQYEALSGKLSGVAELRIPFDADTWRVYHTAEFDEVIYVIDAGMKKSHEVGKIPKEQVERLGKRLKQARKSYAEDKASIVARHRERREAREAHLELIGQKQQATGIKP